MHEFVPGRIWLERILGWDFERIVLAHGHLIERGGKAVFAEAMRWLTG
ncbi:MAG: hypothetical protein ACTSUD_11610 [Alphaproteobacteria bacterium]